MFVTDETHKTTLQRQLADTEQLIARTTTDFQQRHGTHMPDDNVWLAHPRTEQAALTQLLSIMDTRPGRAVQGGACAASSGPVPLTLDTSRAQEPAMSHDDRARRSAVPNAAAKAKSQTKTSAAEQAIRALVKRSEPVTFQAVSREAGVSQATHGH